MAALSTGLSGAERKNLEELKARLRGPLIFPADTVYEDARSVWNAMIDRRPAAVARCLGTADVAACVNFARESGMTLCIKGGGHNIAGLAVAEGGMMLDMSLMRGVWVNPAARTARAQAGCLLGDVDRETQLHGMAAVLGFVSNTGIAGLTLGGGFGYLTSRFGWTCDNVTAFEMVTADGRVVTAREEENSDLFWALRGGGGNFGVVTGIEYALYPVGPEIVGGAIAWRAEEAEQVLDLHREMTAAAPPEFVCVAAMRPAPPAPWIAREAHGKPIVVFFVCDTGPVAEAERRVARLKAFGTPVGDIIQRRTYLSQQSLIDGTQPKGRRYYWKSEYLPRLDPAIYRTMAEHAADIRSSHSAVILFPLGETVGKLPDDHSPMGNRTARWLFNVAASWERPEDDQANISWARAAYEDMRRYSTGGTYVNFLNADDGDDRVRAAYGGNYERLVKAKSAWDPKNLFHVNKNVQPKRH